MKRKRIFALTAILVLTISRSVVICAAAPEEEPAKQEEEISQEEKEEAEYQKKMDETYKQQVQSNAIAGWPKGDGTYSEAAIVMDADTGAILYSKNIDQAEYPASITKILTALIALENGNLSDKVTVSAESLECLGNGYASIGLKENNVLTLEEALYATLLASANEAAYVVGEGVAKSNGKTYDWFLSQMNGKVAELGGTHSNFVNTNGVHDEDHYTCARDMALIAKELFKYPKFLEICQTPEYKISQTPTCEEHVFQQNHEMLVEGYEEYYEYAVGGKTGYTTEAENTLVTLADDGERKLVCVVLKAYPGHVYTDTRKLLEYGFNQFQNVLITEEKRIDGIKAIGEESYITLPKEIEISDLSVSLGAGGDTKKQGTLFYTYKRNPVGEVSVTLRKNFNKADYKAAENRESERPEDRLWKIGIIVCLIVVLLLAFWMLLIYFKRKRRRMHHKRHFR